MRKDRKIYLIIAFLLTIIALPVIYMWFRDRDLLLEYFPFILPVLILVATIGYFALFHLNILYFSVVFLIPLSIQLSNYYDNLPVDLFIPTEPIIICIMLLFISKVIYESSLDINIIKHPVTIVIIINLLWIMLTSISSTMPLVSFKFVLVRIWFLTVFYFLSIEIFKNPSNFKYFITLYSLALVIVITYSTVRLINVGIWNKNASNGICNPFYKDHTSYGAALAIYFIMITGLTAFKFFKKYRYFFVLLSAALLFGLVFSYTRAAWVSVVGAVLIIPFFILKIRFRSFAIVSAIAAIIIIIVSSSVSQQLKQNKQESSTSLSRHLQSITNTTTDASNMERINRWNSAVAMFKEKPILGWGPGTYMFQYAPFQVANEKTVISTNFGEMGNAHSEYLGPLSESGVFGMVSYILIIIFSIQTAFRAFHTSKNKQDRILAVLIITSLFTYYIHGILNNFLDTDKISCPFWGLTAMLVTLDLYAEKKSQNSLKNSVEKS